MTEDNLTTCPACGEPMRWKNLKEPRCMACEPPRPEEPTNLTLSVIQQRWKQDQDKLYQYRDTLRQVLGLPESGHFSDEQILKCVSEAVGKVDQALEETRILRNDADDSREEARLLCSKWKQQCDELEHLLKDWAALKGVPVDLAEDYHRLMGDCLDRGCPHHYAGGPND